MILVIIKAEYKKAYTVLLVFNNGETLVVDLKETILNDHRKIFEPLRNLKYFKKFLLKLNTITWENEADFAPEFLYELGLKQAKKKFYKFYTLLL